MRIYSLIDAHCHLDFTCFNPDRKQLIAQAHRNHVKKIIIPATQKIYWERIKQLCQQADLYACYGLHPYWVNQHKTDDLAELEKNLNDYDCVAVGECGLDFRPGQADKKRQLYYFEAQLTIAQQQALPVVIHAVRATEVVLDILKKYPHLHGMIHSYSGSLEQARQLIDRGFYISIGGAITYPQARKIHRIGQHIPLSALLLETDAPDQPDYSHQGERNQPAYLVNTLQAVAELRDEDTAVIATQTTLNTENLFNLPGS